VRTITSASRLAVTAVSAAALAAGLAVPAGAAVPAAGGVTALDHDGRLGAEGRGFARLDGVGWSAGLVRGGVITVRDRAGDATVRVGGRTYTSDRRARRGVVRIRVKEARRYVVFGTDIVLTIRGRMAVGAAGRFDVRLVGRGTCRVDGGPAVRWDGMPVRLGDGTAAERHGRD
jgi:hypothetical protein